MIKPSPAVIRLQPTTHDHMPSSPLSPLWISCPPPSLPLKPRTPYMPPSPPPLRITHLKRKLSISSPPESPLLPCVSLSSSSSLLARRRSSINSAQTRSELRVTLLLLLVLVGCCAIVESTHRIVVPGHLVSSASMPARRGGGDAAAAWSEEGAEHETDSSQWVLADSESPLLHSIQSLSLDANTLLTF